MLGKRDGEAVLLRVMRGENKSKRSRKWKNARETPKDDMRKEGVAKGQLGKTVYEKSQLMQGEEKKTGKIVEDWWAKRGVSFVFPRSGWSRKKKRKGVSRNFGERKRGCFQSESPPKHRAN